MLLDGFLRFNEAEAIKPRNQEYVHHFVQKYIPLQ